MIEPDAELIPIPPKNSKRAKYPWDSLTEGQSFLVPITHSEWRRIEARIWASFSQWKQQHGASFTITTRRMKDGIRVWRKDTEKKA